MGNPFNAGLPAAAAAGAGAAPLSLRRARNGAVPSSGFTNATARPSRTWRNGAKGEVHLLREVGGPCDQW